MFPVSFFTFPLPGYIRDCIAEFYEYSDEVKQKGNYLTQCDTLQKWCMPTEL